MPTRRPARRTGFTLVELLLIIAIIALLISILLPALGKARKSARLAVCESNMRQSATALSTYSADSRGTLCSFSWKPGATNTAYADLTNVTDPVMAHAYQAVDIARRRAPHATAGYYTPFSDRIMDRNFSHLPLIDGGYFSDRMPEPTTACPEDRTTLLWQKGAYDDTFITSILAQTGDPDPNSSNGFKRQLPFWCTYQFVPYVWSADRGPGLVYQATGAPGYHFLFNVPGNAKWVTRALDDVLFPSQKVWQFDLWDRHFAKRELWYAYSTAAQPIVFFDGSVSVRKTRDANPGWNPSAPTSPSSTVYLYWPVGSDPPTRSGAPYESVTGYFRWTRSGLKGVDFGGKEQWRN